MNAAYWGFVPAVKEAVQDAVQVAVRKAVHEIVVPTGSHHDDTSDAYRRFVGDSLAEAAKDADNYLRRASLWNEPPSSIRASEGAINFEGGSPKVTIRKHDSLDSPSGLKQSDAAARSFSNKRGSKPSNQDYYSRGGSVYASLDNIETIPLEAVDEKFAENHKLGWKIPGIGKKVSSRYTAIPTRRSSKNRILSSRNRTTANSSARESPKGSRPRKHSSEELKRRRSGS